jgi:protocatechuate 3,4-dioxygenase beta subunit
VSARPSLKGKRGKSTTTDKKGYYEIRGLVPKSYIIMFTLPDGRIFEVSADAKTNEKVVVDFTVPE